MSAPTSPPLMPGAGWYPDPEQPWSWRWWDGMRWTDQRAPMVGAAPSRNPHSVSAWFDDSVAAVKLVIVRVGLLVLAAFALTAGLVGVFGVAVFTSGRGRTLRSLLSLDDVFAGNTDTIELTDAEWSRAGDLATDIAVASIPWVLALTVIAAIVAAWSAAICARVAQRVGSDVVVSRFDDVADAVRRVPVVIAAFVVVAAIVTGVAAVVLLPLVVVVAAGAGGAAIAVAAVFGSLAATVLVAWIVGRLALTVALAALGGWGLGLRRSWELTDGRYWATVGRLLLASLVAGAASVPFSVFNSFGLSFGFVTWLVVLLVAQTVANVVNTVVTVPAQVVLVRHLTEQAGAINRV